MGRKSMPSKPWVEPGSVPARLLAVRLRLGLTAKEAASRCGFGAQAWYDLERGVRSDGVFVTPTLDRLWRIAAALGVDPHELDERLASTKK